MDLLMAAQALSHHFILLTHNEKEFKQVKGLKIENWTKG
jgi:tRNA(fMet)-specific endonuclease VapC